VGHGRSAAARRPLEAVADRLDELATVCRPASESFLNPAKTLALDLAGTLPLVWGSSDLAGVAAYRLTCQLNENAKYPAIHGALPEPNHNQVVTFAGPSADSLADSVAGSAGPRLRLVLLRDGEEHPRLARRCTASRQLAEEAGVPVSELRAEGSHPLLRLAQLVATGDFASVYLALLLGIDPEPITPLTELKERIAR
jgi:glucose/mannose-6-phosphate isomerase